MEDNTGMITRDVELIRDYLYLMKSYANHTIDEAMAQTHEDKEFISALVKEQRRRVHELDRLIAVTGDEIDALRAAEHGKGQSTPTKEKASKAHRKRSKNTTKQSTTGGKKKNDGRKIQNIS